MKKLFILVLMSGVFAFTSCTSENENEVVALPVSEKSRELTDAEKIDSIANSIHNEPNPYQGNYEVPADANVSFRILCQGETENTGRGTTCTFMVRYNANTSRYEYGFYYVGLTRNSWNSTDSGGWLWAQWVCCCSGWL